MIVEIVLKVHNASLKMIDIVFNITLNGRTEKRIFIDRV